MFLKIELIYYCKYDVSVNWKILYNINNIKKNIKKNNTENNFINKKVVFLREVSYFCALNKEIS